MTRFSKAKGLYSVGACSRDPVSSAGSRGAMAAFKGTAGLREVYSGQTLKITQLFVYGNEYELSVSVCVCWCYPLFVLIPPTLSPLRTETPAWGRL